LVRNPFDPLEAFDNILFGCGIREADMPLAAVAKR
jgi:hypothetical protein